jgi:hypothetical protein
VSHHATTAVVAGEGCGFESRGLCFMRTVQSLRDELAKFPADALCYAYEGEVTGVVVVRAEPKRQELGCVVCISGTQRDADTQVRGPDGHRYLFEEGEAWDFGFLTQPVT